MFKTDAHISLIFQEKTPTPEGQKLLGYEQSKGQLYPHSRDIRPSH